jgi:hypothetical protein
MRLLQGRSMTARALLIARVWAVTDRLCRSPAKAITFCEELAELLLMAPR